MVAYPISPAASPWSSGVMGVSGLAEGGQQIALSTVSTAGSIMAGSAPLWTQAAWAVPVIGAAVAGIALAITAWFSRKGPKQKVATTQVANEVAGMMEQNKAAYLAGPHTISSQAQALANFDALWNALVERCGDPEMGDPGDRCISERQRGGVWDMARDNRDPIANDPNVVADPTALDTAGDSVNQVLGSIGLGGGGGMLLLAGAALLLAFSMGGSK